MSAEEEIEFRKRVLDVTHTIQKHLFAPERELLTVMGQAEQMIGLMRADLRDRLRIEVGK